jgi:hypothetical protein
MTCCSTFFNTVFHRTTVKIIPSPRVPGLAGLPIIVKLTETEPIGNMPTFYASFPETFEPWSMSDCSQRDSTLKTIGKQDMLLHSLLRYPWKTKNVTEIVLLRMKNGFALDEDSVGQLLIDPLFCSALTQFSLSAFAVNCREGCTFSKEWLVRLVSVRPSMASLRCLNATELSGLALNEGMSLIPNLLDLGFCDVRPEHLVACASCWANLQRLKIRSATFIHFDSATLDSGVLALAKYCTQLQAFELGWITPETAISARPLSMLIRNNPSLHAVKSEVVARTCRLV